MLWLNIFNGPDIADTHNNLDPLSGVDWTEGHVYLMYDPFNRDNNVGQLYVDVADNRRICIGGKSSGQITPIDPSGGGDSGGDDSGSGSDSGSTTPIGNLAFDVLRSKQFQGLVKSTSDSDPELYHAGIPYSNDFSLRDFTFGNLQDAIFYVPQIVDANHYLPILSAASENGIWSLGPSNHNTFAFYYADTDTGYIPNPRKTAIYLYPDGSVAAPYGSVCGKYICANIGNDFAEYRRATETITAGHCVIENGDGSVILSSKRLQPGASIVSDTYGVVVGKQQQNTIPLATAGRVLVYPNENRTSYHIGAPVCSGPMGTVSQMTREEAREYPERIIGTVSEIPDYVTWNDVLVDGRIWIKL